MLIPNILLFSEIPISHSLFHSLLEGKRFPLIQFSSEEWKGRKSKNEESWGKKFITKICYLWENMYEENETLFKIKLRCLLSHSSLPLINIGLVLGKTSENANYIKTQRSNSRESYQRCRLFTYVISP